MRKIEIKIWPNHTVTISCMNYEIDKWIEYHSEFFNDIREALNTIAKMELN